MFSIATLKDGSVAGRPFSSAFFGCAEFLCPVEAETKAGPDVRELVVEEQKGVPRSSAILAKSLSREG